ncbi:MAG: endonuclease V [Candidatus Njordarchaeota archaeon]
MRYVYPKLKIVYETPDIYILVLEALRRIPRGKVTTYGEIGIALGDKVAARAVGYIMATNKRPDVFPCYKVVNKDGSVGKYSLGQQVKIRKLVHDGIRIYGDRIVNFDEVVVKSDDIYVPSVLKSLQKMQNLLAEKIDLEGEDIEIRYVSTFDLSYIDGPPDISIGVGCLFDLEKDVLKYVSIAVIPVFMPYIPTYLAFRELPAILLALESIVDIRHPDIVVLDGQGILHPRLFGIASHIGILTGIPSIGIAKSVLVGNIREEWRKIGKFKVAPIFLGNKIRGYAVEFANHRIIVSPGHKISIDQALKFVLGLKWNKNESEPSIMRAPHNIAKIVRKNFKQIIDNLRNKQKSLLEFVS